MEQSLLPIALMTIAQRKNGRLRYIESTMFSFRRKKPVVPPAVRLPVRTEHVIGELLDTVEREVVREERVTARDVLEGRLRSDSFYDAETEKLPFKEQLPSREQLPLRPRPPLPPLLTPTPGSLSPIVLSQLQQRVPLPPPPPPPPSQPVVRRSSYGMPSGPWAFALIVLGGVAAFLAFAIHYQPRSTPAHAPPAATDTIPITADAGVERSIRLPATSPR